MLTKPRNFSKGLAGVPIAPVATNRNTLTATRNSIFARCVVNLLVEPDRIARRQGQHTPSNVSNEEQVTAWPGWWYLAASRDAPVSHPARSDAPDATEGTMLRHFGSTCSAI